MTEERRKLIHEAVDKFLDEYLEAIIKLGEDS